MSFISPGELQRGQWLIIHSNIEKEKNFNDQPVNPLLNLIQMTGLEQPMPLLVLAVQNPFMVVANCLQQMATTFIIRTDEKNFMELTEEFVQAYDPSVFARGQMVLRQKIVSLTSKKSPNNYGDPDLGTK